VEEGTKKVSLIGSFASIRAPEFPLLRPQFCVFAALTDGQGEATAQLSVTHLETDREVYTLLRGLRFPDRFTEVRILFRLLEFRFPAPGSYLFTLLIDGEWAAHRRIRVYQAAQEGS
jgi:hypothetical protein